MNGFLPSLKARRSISAREVVARALTKYYQRDGLKQGSKLAQGKYSTAASYGFEFEDIARIEVPFMIAVLNNTVATSFWLLCNILTSPDLLEMIRNELSKAITTVAPTSDGAPTKHTIHLDQMKTSCPILISVFKETLRTRSSFSIFRYVTADTLLENAGPQDESYLLKTGSIVQLSTDIIHNSSQHWGTRATEFDHTRFMDPNKKSNPSAFRSFGGAPYTCPGRQFAAMEILAVTAMMVARYDIFAKNDGEKIITPPQKMSQFGTVPPPIKELEVRFQERDGWKGEWNIVRGEVGIPWKLGV